MNHDSYIFESPIGLLEIAAYEGKITHLTPISGHVPEIQHSGKQHGFLSDAARQIVAFLNGSLKQLALPVHFQGTELQQKVWTELMRIPYGQTISYTEMAKRIGNPKAVRAVGTACGQNPIPLIIPCHRVLRSNGALGGFAWGLAVKEYLLLTEQKQLRAAA